MEIDLNVFVPLLTAYILFVCLLCWHLAKEIIEEEHSGDNETDWHTSSILIGHGMIIPIPRSKKAIQSMKKAPLSLSFID